MSIDSVPIWRSERACVLGENPLWDAEASTLYWVDVIDPAVYAYANDTLKRFPMPKPVASIYLARPGQLLVALRSTFVWLDCTDASVTPVAAANPLPPDERFNDGRCDRDGVLWISTMDRHLASEIGSLVRIAPLAEAQRFPSHAILGNGVCFSPDDRFLYFSDTHRRAIFRYDKARFEEGGPLERTLFVDMSAGLVGAGKPDGCAIDTDGCLWSASIGGGRIERYSPDGRLVGTLDLPVSHPTHCAFGGSDLRTLFVTTARAPGLAPDLDKQPLAGHIFAFNVPAQGLPEHRLAAHMDDQYAQ